MVKYQGLILLITIMTTSLVFAQDSFSSSTARLIGLKNQMVAEMKILLKWIDDLNGLRKFASTMKSLKNEMKVFFGTDVKELDSVKSLRALQTAAKSESEAGKEDDLYKDKTLADNNNQRYWKVMKELAISPFISYDLVCQMLAGKNQVNFGEMLSGPRICIGTITCPNREYCINLESNPPKWCNMHKATPAMTGLMSYLINELIFQKMCPGNCPDGKCNFANSAEEVLKEIDRVLYFALFFSSPFDDTWKPFFNKALSQQGFTNIDSALSMVKEKMEDFEIVQGQCTEIEFAVGCDIGSIYQNYKMLKKIQQKNGDVGQKIKDLRYYSDMDLDKMIQLQKDNIQQSELLKNIKKINDNMQASVAGISRYFEGLAKFDQGIAENDVAFIKQELEKYETSLKSVQTKIQNDVSDGMKYMLAILGANLYEEIYKLTVSILTNSNPLKLIFSGPDVVDVMDRAGAVANAASNLVKGSALFKALTSLSQDTGNLAAAFWDNGKQIKSMYKLVEKIKSGNKNDVDKDSNDFLKEYGNYTPKTDGSTLAANDALWSAFKDAMCDVLNGDVGMGGSIPKSIVGSKLLCERLDGTLAQFFTLRADIFDFQFQMVDSLAAVVRGNIAQKFASSIKGKHDTLPASAVMTGFLMSQLKIQTICTVYCNLLEYKNHGKSVDACATNAGLYRKENIDHLIAFTQYVPHDEVDREIYFPSTPTGKGDTGVVDLQSLANGQTVLFKVPLNRDWLVKYGWILPYENGIPYLKSLKLFLPQRDYKNQNFTTTMILLTSVAGSSVSLSGGSVYLIKPELNKFRTIYEEGYFQCNSEIENPYSLCANHLPKICDKTRRMPGNSLLPTILSTFRIQAFVSQGPHKINYSAPVHDTQILLRAKATLMVPLRAKKKHHIPDSSGPKSKRSDVLSQRDGCCDEGNGYKVLAVHKRCVPCPTGTTSMVRGLYCKPNDVKA